MADGRREEMWNHTSHLLAMLVNVNRVDAKADPVHPCDFNPYAPKPVPVEIPVSSLRGLFKL